MTKNNAFFLLALCPLVPAASRLSYGLVLALGYVWLFLVGLLFRIIVKKIYSDQHAPFLDLVCVGGSITLFSLVLHILSPVLAISLSLYIYLSAFSYLFVSRNEISLGAYGDFKIMIPFIPTLLVLSMVREIVSYGTISIPSHNGFSEFTIIPGYTALSLGFWGTSGGTLIILGIAAWLTIHVQSRSSGFRSNS